MNLTPKLIVAVVSLALISISFQRNIGRQLSRVSVDVKNIYNDTHESSTGRSHYGGTNDMQIDQTPSSSPRNKFIHEPFTNRWQRRFSSLESRGKTGGYLFHKHIRKAGGTTLRSFLYQVFEYHDQSRSFDLSPVAGAAAASGVWEKKYQWKGNMFQHKKKMTAFKNKRRKGSKSNYTVHYIEQEFDAMDWQCSTIDPRWNDSLRVITLRHPIERHFSEFFYSGPGQFFAVNKTLLLANQTYDRELKGFINTNFPLWMKVNHAYPVKEKTRGKSKKSRRIQLQRTFGRFYTDNFQLRALAGDGNLDKEGKKGLQRSLALTSHDSPNENCTIYFITNELLFDSCHKGGPSTECPNGCDAPCFYEAVAKGPLERKHLVRARDSLESFDAVLLLDNLNDETQSDFLSDMMGVPRDSQFSLKNKDSKNFRVEKSNRREKTHFYRDLMSNLGLNSVAQKLHKENELEIELFEYAVKLNEIMIDQWKRETVESKQRGDSAIENNELEATPTISEDMALSSHDAADEEPTANLAGEDNYVTANLTANADGSEDAHDFGVIVVMYHKTGYVLSRILMKNTIGLEYEARGRSKKEVNSAKSIMGPSVDHVDENTGETIAFGQRGNWNSNFVPARRHAGIASCPSSFKLSRGAIFLQEAPDLYCSDIELAQRMLGFPPQKGGKAKIVHFVRGAFSMVLSNYFYHSQEPTPEPWVHIDDPCEFKYENGESLAIHVLPTLKERTKITQKHFDAVVGMCKTLFQSDATMKNATFYEHLLKLNHWDGLRLATAQMVIASSSANKHLAGGDILRLANNLIKFENIRTSPSIPLEQRKELHLLTLSMDDYIDSPKTTTMNFLNFVLGSNDTIVSSSLRSKMAEDMANSGKKKKGNSHVTQGKHEDKEELRQLLREDSVLGPILSEVEILVQDALEKSAKLASLL